MKNFYANKKLLNEITFNGSNVNKVYYNNVLVWDGEYSMSDLYALCKQRQNGTINAFPPTVRVGMRVPVSVSGYGTFYAELIDIESSGTGVLIFQQKTALEGFALTNSNYSLTNISSYMKQFLIGYTKGCRPTSYGNPTVDYAQAYRYVWDLSYLEVTNKSYFYANCYSPPVYEKVEWEYILKVNAASSYHGSIYHPTYIKFPYLQEAANRICYDENGKAVKYQLRSAAAIPVGSDTMAEYDPIFVYAVLEDGSVGPNNGSACTNGSGGPTEYSMYKDRGYTFPCFAIG
jgi:hypothetical protein